MFGSKPKLSPMCLEHIPIALEIIAAHDEDDAECAEETYAESLEGQYIFHKGNTILGITGFEAAGDIGTISWTYVAEDHRKQGHGTAMMQQLIKLMQKLKLRKAYVQTSDFRESPWEPMLYEDAVKLYKKLGFREEGYHPHYYEKDEGMLIYGMRIGDPPLMGNHPSRENADGIELGEVFLLEETETTYAIDWHEEGAGALTTEGVMAAIEQAKSRGAKAIFISFPSTFALNLYSIISSAGFREEVQLTDYHADGIHEVRYRFNPDDENQTSTNLTYPKHEVNY